MYVSVNVRVHKSSSAYVQKSVNFKQVCRPALFLFSVCESLCIFVYQFLVVNFILGALPVL